MAENSTLILIDNRYKELLGAKLSLYGKVMGFMTNGISYEAISCHPDIFIFQSPEGIIISPNTPAEYKAALRNAGVSYIEGRSRVGPKHPESAAYNAFADDSIIVYSEKATDKSILDLCSSLIKIPVNQSYIRCNMINTGSGAYLTSDAGIHKALKSKGFDSYFLSPSGIFLKGYTYGFLGGCAGFYQNQLFFSGTFDYFPQGGILRDILLKENIVFHELYNGVLLDVGGIFFI